MKLVDLSLKIDIKDLRPLYPLVKDIKIEPVFHLDNDGFNISKISIYSHCGTHIDVPYHMIKNGNKLEQYSIDRFVGNAIVLNLNVGEYGEIHAKELDEALNFSGLKVNKGDFLIINTKWWHKYYDNKYDSEYLAERHPGLFLDAAEWIINKGFKLLGVDFMTVRHPSLAPKYTGIKPERVHVKLLSNDILIVEQLVNLDKISNKKVIFAALPLNLVNLDGSPVRAFAIEE
ncbi:MAG: cyclase family protein [Nitrososphaeria archaeon]